MKRLFIMTAVLLCLSYTADAQVCPSGANIDANTFCIFLTWDTPPAPLPTEVVTNGADTYPFFSGTGIVGDQAIYKNGGGGGACNASQSPFTGTISYDGATYIFDAGVCTGSFFPIQLVSFQIEYKNGDVLLNWITENEINNNRFEIERSLNAHDWHYLFTIKGNGTTTQRQYYQAVDDSPLPGVSYYRFKQVDDNSDFEYSPVRSILGTSSNGLHAFYLPSQELIRVTGLQENQQYSIQITNLLGSVSLSKTIRTSSSIEDMDVSQLPIGLYLIEASTEFQKSTNKLAIY